MHWHKGVAGAAGRTWHGEGSRGQSAGKGGSKGGEGKGGKGKGQDVKARMVCADCGYWTFKEWAGAMCPACPDGHWKVPKARQTDEKDEKSKESTEGVPAEEEVELAVLRRYLGSCQNFDVEELYKKKIEEEKAQKAQEGEKKKTKGKRLAEARDELQKAREAHLKLAKDLQNLRQKRDAHAKAMEEAAAKAAQKLDDMDIKLVDVEAQHLQAEKDLEEKTAGHKQIQLEPEEALPEGNSMEVDDGKQKKAGEGGDKKAGEVREGEGEGTEHDTKLQERPLFKKLQQMEVPSLQKFLDERDHTDMWYKVAKSIMDLKSVVNDLEQQRGKAAPKGKGGNGKGKEGKPDERGTGSGRRWRSASEGRDNRRGRGDRSRTPPGAKSKEDGKDPEEVVDDDQFNEEEMEVDEKEELKEIMATQQRLQKKIAERKSRLREEVEEKRRKGMLGQTLAGATVAEDEETLRKREEEAKHEAEAAAQAEARRPDRL